MPRHIALPVAVLAALLPSCGHRGDPLPPRRKTPPPPRDFRLAQRGDDIEVRATAPIASVDGVPYETIEIEFLHVDGTKDLEKSGARRAVPATPGARVTITLPLPAPGTLVRAAARVVAGREKGPRTLTTTLVAQTPLEAPRDLAAVLTPGGVSLSWRGPRPKEVAPPAVEARPPGPSRTPSAGTPPFAPAAPAKPEAGGSATPTGQAPDEAPPAAGPRRSGFFVYRRVGEAGFGSPFAGEPLERRGTEDTDVPPGVTACYVVRAVASTEPLVESGPSNEACVAVRDIAAPDAPAGLAVLPREGGLEILWSPSAASDLAGYRVYRTAPGGERERVAEVGVERSSWLDGTAAPGAVYSYVVAAFDQSGNESEPSEAVEASLP
jgi:hypothetical protein